MCSYLRWECEGCEMPVPESLVKKCGVCHYIKALPAFFAHAACQERHLKYHQRVDNAHKGKEALQVLKPSQLFLTVLVED